MIAHHYTPIELFNYLYLTATHLFLFVENRVFEKESALC